MKKRILAALLAAGLLTAQVCFAEEATAAEAAAAETEETASAEIQTQTGVLPFIFRYARRMREVEYYDNVYANNHDRIGLQPFSAAVPAEYFVADGSGNLALAPIVLDITDAVRERLYGSDVGETAMYYGQYCDLRTGYKHRLGYSGIHEGLDFRCVKNAPLFAVLDGVVTRAGDSNGTVAVYNEQYDYTVLYLHCRKICVRRGQTITAGTQIAREGKKKAGEYYTHIEVRKGRHTSSNKYRNVAVESDCPYELFREALGVTESGRQPMTLAAVQEADAARIAAEEEARKKAEEEAAAQAAAAEEARKQEEAQLNIVEETDNSGNGYGFTEDQATPTPVPEATLPPSV